MNYQQVETPGFSLSLYLKLKHDFYKRPEHPIFNCPVCSHDTRIVILVIGLLVLLVLLLSR